MERRLEVRTKKRKRCSATPRVVGMRDRSSSAVFSLLAPLLVGVSAFLIAGCASSPEVVRVEDDAPIKGLRYKLQRPKIVVAIVLNLRGDDNSTPDIRVVDKTVEFEAPAAELDWIPSPPEESESQPSHEKTRKHCIHTGEGAKPELNLRVRQVLSKRYDLYEVRSPSWLRLLPAFLSDRTITLKLDDEGFLTSAESKVTDSTSELLTSLVGLITTVDAPLFRAVAASASESKNCLVIQDRKFHEYVEAALRSKEAIEDLEARKYDIDQALRSASPSEFKAISEALERVEKDLLDEKTLYGKLEYVVPKGFYTLKLDGAVTDEFGEPEATPTLSWFTLDLEPVRPKPTP